MPDVLVLEQAHPVQQRIGSVGPVPDRQEPGPAQLPGSIPAPEVLHGGFGFGGKYNLDQDQRLEFRLKRRRTENMRQHYEQKEFIWLLLRCFTE